MDDNYLISVIVPVFNAELYIKRGIESILLQNIDDIQIVLVDDGSTDNSGTICDEFTDYNNVVVIHQKNSGATVARNAGLAKAQGKYITFMDADDYFEENAFSSINNILNHYDPDLLDFGYYYLSSTLEKIPVLNGNNKNELLDLEYIINDIIPPVINMTSDKSKFIFDFVWGKVFKKNIIIKNNIYFDENRRVWEDRPFLAQYLKYCKTYYSIDQFFYNYVNVDGSLSQRFSTEFPRIVLENYQLYYSLYKNNYDFSCQYVSNYWGNTIENIIIKQLENKKEHPEVVDVIRQVLKESQVLIWFENREISKNFQKEIVSCLRQNKYDKVIEIYENIIKKNKTFENSRKFCNKVKVIMRKLLKDS